MTMRIAQISDPHITAAPPRRGGCDPAANLRAVVEMLAGLERRPDLVVFSGDLTEDGTPEQYREFLDIAAPLPLPMAAVPGNHDRRNAFVAALRDTPIEIGDGAPFLNLSIDRGSVRVVCLDTIGEEGGATGRVCPERRGWLSNRLAESAKPTIVFMHHQPFQIGQPIADFVGLSACDSEALEALIREHPQVRAVSAGHVHRAAHRFWAGTEGNVCPAVTQEVAFDLVPDGVPRLEPQNPGFQIHDWSRETGLVTHTQFLPGFI